MVIRSGSRSGVKFGVKDRGLNVRGQGQGEGEGVGSLGGGLRSGGLGSDGRWGLVGGRMEINRECSFQELMIEFHSIPTHSMLYQMPNSMHN